MRYSNHRSGRSCAGFTLIELLIVVGIITILIVLGLSVGGKVIGTGKVEATKQTLRALDVALTELTNAKDGQMPPAWVVDPRPTNNMGRVVQPVLDGRCGSTLEPINSVGLFMLQCKSVPAAAAALTKIDSKFLHEYTPDLGGGGGFDTQPSIPTAFDAWGHPIRYVHPQFKGTFWQGMPSGPQTGFIMDVGTMLPAPPGNAYGIMQVRRNNTPNAGQPAPADQPDSDGGINPGTRPYFYSAGPDGDPSTIADNIYLTVPRVAKN